MTRYREDFACPVAFAEQEVRNTMAEVLAEHGLRQLHVAETEKYAHVTYFFNGGDEHEWPGRTRILVPSPRDVADVRPEAGDVRARGGRPLRRARSRNGYGFAIVNFANPDMVGHTGVDPRRGRGAVETVGRVPRAVVAAVEAPAGVCLVTADHGNAELMIAADGSPHTAHTTNPVPLVVTDRRAARCERRDSRRPGPDRARLLGLPAPAEMTGAGLIER